MTQNMLELRNVTKSFGTLEVLNNISLQCKQGEFVSILGPSGAGKSTIFNLLTGAQFPEHGDIFFNEKPLYDKIRPFAFMPQRDALMPWRSIMNNITLGLEVQGMPRKQARDCAAPLFAEFGLLGFENNYPAELSGGMRQRAALLRTVIQRRPILLLDEPFGALDALTRLSMQRWLESMWLQHGWTVLLITHDVREAVALSDRIYVVSARPARNIREIEVSLPCPRMQTSRLDQEWPDNMQTVRMRTAIETEILDILLHQERAET